jgi:hypothetical protein
MAVEEGDFSATYGVGLAIYGRLASIAGRRRKILGGDAVRRWAVAVTTLVQEVLLGVAACARW